MRQVAEGIFGIMKSVRLIWSMGNCLWLLSKMVHKWIDGSNAEKSFQSCTKRTFGLSMALTLEFNNMKRHGLNPLKVREMHRAVVKGD